MKMTTSRLRLKYLTSKFIMKKFEICSILEGNHDKEFILVKCIVELCLVVILQFLPSGKQTLKVREHKVTGPYVDGLTKLVVSSFQVCFLTFSYEAALIC